MQRNITILLLTLLMASCHHAAVETQNLASLPTSVSHQKIQAIDSLMWQQPDSALAMMVQFAASPQADSLDEFDRHYCQLLISELLYKNDYGQTNRKALLEAVDYFDTLCCRRDARFCVSTRQRRDAPWCVSTANTNVFLDARAHYIKGVGFYERDSLVEACAEYLKTLEIMEEWFEEKELVGLMVRFMALTYTRLTELYSVLYLHEQVIYFGQLALRYYRSVVNPCWYEAWILDEIGSNFEMDEQLDSAQYYYQSAIESLSDTGVLLFRDIFTHQIQLQYKLGEQPEVLIQQLHRILSRANDDRERLARSFSLGAIYYYEKQFDSAWHYLDKVFQESTRAGSKKQSAEWLIEICNNIGKVESVHEYANYLVPFATQDENNGVIKSRLMEMYKAYCQRSQEQSHKKEVMENWKLTWIVAMGFLLALSLFAVLYHLSRRKRLHLEARIEEEQLLHAMQQKSLSGRLKKSNEELRKEKAMIKDHELEQCAIINSDKELSSGRDRYEKFIKTPICVEIIDRFRDLHSDSKKMLKTDINIADYKLFALSDKQLVELLKTFESFFPDLIEAWKVSYPSLSRKDMPYLSLYLLQLDKMSICIFLQESYQTCRRHTIKLEQAFKCQYGLTSFIMEQINIH